MRVGKTIDSRVGGSQLSRMWRGLISGLIGNRLGPRVQSIVRTRLREPVVRQVRDRIWLPVYGQVRRVA